MEIEDTNNGTGMRTQLRPQLTSSTRSNLIVKLVTYTIKIFPSFMHYIEFRNEFQEYNYRGHIVDQSGFCNPWKSALKNGILIYFHKNANHILERVSQDRIKIPLETNSILNHIL